MDEAEAGARGFRTKPKPQATWAGVLTAVSALDPPNPVAPHCIDSGRLQGLVTGRSTQNDPGHLDREHSDPPGEGETSSLRQPHGDLGP